MDQSGKAYVFLENQAPLTIGDIMVEVLYLDEKGEQQQFSRKINQNIEAGKSANIPLGLSGYTDYKDLEQRLRVSASSARAMD